MSQHDLTIANGAGSIVRTDLQNAAQALGSTSKGPSAPATIYAGQQWIDDDSPSGTIWTMHVYDGAQSIGLWYIDTANNVAYPVSAMPLLGFSAQGSPVMAGDIRTTAATAVPGSGNSTLGYNLAANGSLHLSNNGSYVASLNRNGNGTIAVFNISGTVVGSITVSGSSTAYVTSSDRRLKTNIEDIDWHEAAAILARLKPRWFNWISNPMSPRVDGFIADEAQEVLPHIVVGEKDAVDDKGRIAPQGIDQSKLTPLLTAAVKGLLAELAVLTAIVSAQEERLAALEAARG